MVPEDERESRVKDYVRRLRYRGPVFAISALARQGLDALVTAIYAHVSQHAREQPPPDPRFDEPVPAGRGQQEPGA
jgi:GTP-binding protein